MRTAHWVGAALAAAMIILGMFAVASGFAAERHSGPLTVGQDDPMRGFVRERFCTWAKAGNCLNTRGKMLASQSEVPATITSCVVRSGQWTDFYTGLPIRGLPDVDHLVPVGEAWRSGGRDWPREKRMAFCNDADGGNLVLTDSRLNESKGSRDPATWMPPKDKRCEFLRRWVDVKARYGLRADPAEADAIEAGLALCPP